MSAALAMPFDDIQQVALARAVLCQDCEMVSNTPYHACPACGSQALLPIVNVLNREVAEVPDVHAPWTAWRKRRSERG